MFWLSVVIMREKKFSASTVFEEIAYVSEVEDYVNVFTNEGMKARDLRIPSHDFLWLKTSF